MHRPPQTRKLARAPHCAGRFAGIQESQDRGFCYCFTPSPRRISGKRETGWGSSPRSVFVYSANAFLSSASAPGPRRERRTRAARQYPRCRRGPQPQFPPGGRGRDALAPPPGRPRSGRRLRGPAPALPGFRLPGHVPGAPPEAPGGPWGGGGGGGAEVGGAAPRPGSARGSVAPAPTLPGPGRPSSRSLGRGLPQCRPPRAARDQDATAAEPAPGLPTAALPAGSRGSPGVRPSLTSRPRCPALSTGHAPGAVAVARGQSLVPGRGGGAGGHRQTTQRR